MFWPLFHALRVALVTSNPVLDFTKGQFRQGSRDAVEKGVFAYRTNLPPVSGTHDYQLMQGGNVRGQPPQGAGCSSFF